MLIRHEYLQKKCPPVPFHDSWSCSNLFTDMTTHTNTFCYDTNICDDNYCRGEGKQDLLFRYLYAWFSKYKFFFIGITKNVIRACTFLKIIYFIWLCLRLLIHEKYENLVFEGSRNFLSVSWGCNRVTVYIWYGFLQQHTYESIYFILLCLPNL